MKSTFLFFVVFLLATLASAQNTPVEFFDAVPQPPSNPCDADMEEKMQFENEIANFRELIRQKSEEEQQAAETFQEKHEAEMTVNALMKAGFSREDAEKMKNLENMSEEQKNELANQMMNNNYGMNMAQAQKVSKYNEQALQNWGKAQSTMTMAEAQVDPEGKKKVQLEMKTDLELQQEYRFLRDKLSAGENKYIEKFRQIDDSANVAKAKMEPQIEKLRKDLENGNGDSKQIINKIQTLRNNFCRKFTPTYLETVEAYKGYIVEHLQEYYQLEELQMKSVERQTGVRDPNYKPGIIPMSMLASYLNLVGGALKYNENLAWGAQFIGY